MHVGICLDIGHAHIAAGLAGCGVAELVEPVLDRVILFHVHDNFGADDRRSRAGAHEPVRLDLHLPPGSGTVPWSEIGPMLLVWFASISAGDAGAREPPPASAVTAANDRTNDTVTALRNEKDDRFICVTPPVSRTLAGWFIRDIACEKL